jgi:sugar lactone lactonase YvrE
MELIDIVPVRNTLGEGILWDAEAGVAWWTDIQERLLYRYDPGTREIERIATPERLGSFGLVRGSHKLLAAFESGLALFDPANGAVEWLARPKELRPGLRFNDGRVDRQGRFWAGTMVEGDAPDITASLYCLDGKRRLHCRASGIRISNGICWSPDGTRFYFADSPLRVIYVYNFDPARGEIANRRLFAATPEGAFPDGANVDAKGFLWSAHWGAGRVVRYAPDGSIDRTIEVPASQPTCIAFGGPDLDLLFVTSAREGLNRDALARHPSAGDLFLYRVDACGLSEPRFAFDSGEHDGCVADAERNDELIRPRPESDV